MESTLLRLEITSRALRKSMQAQLYLPPYYGQFKMRYPVVYLLHPWGCNERYHLDSLKLRETADHLINAGTIPPFIAVMPQGDKSFFINASDPPDDYSSIIKSDPEHFKGALEGYGRYGDYLLDEVIPLIEKTYEVRTDRSGRVIAGFSMGATGAGILAFTYPSMFAAVGIHSPTLFDDLHLGPPWIFGLGDQEAFARRDPICLAKQLPPDTGLNIYLDCGVDDDLSEAADELHWALLQRRIAHTYVSRPGGHGQAYWQLHLAEYLGFYAGGW
jgi:enterochelin esterase-like enzyme